MSTKTAFLSAGNLMAHVPVDRFEIVNGPGMMACFAIQNRLVTGTTTNPLSRENVVFTLKTAASTEAFRRTLQVASIFSVQNGEFEFTAIFCGRVVSGIYDMKTRTGWFNLD